MKEKKLMVGDYDLDIVLNQIKQVIGIEKSHNTKILIDTDDKLPDGFVLTLIQIEMWC